VREPYVYLLASRPYGALYLGVTSNLPRRVWEHKEGHGSRHADRYGIHRLVWAEPHATMLEAIAREKAIKKWRRPWKVELIEAANPDWADLYEQLLA